MPVLTRKKALLQEDIMVADEYTLTPYNQNFVGFYWYPKAFNAHAILKEARFLDKQDAYNTIALILGGDAGASSEWLEYKYYLHATIDISIPDIQTQEFESNFSVIPLVVADIYGIELCLDTGSYYGISFEFDVSSTKLPQRIEVTSTIGEDDGYLSYCTVQFSNGKVERQYWEV